MSGPAYPSLAFCDGSGPTSPFPSSSSSSGSSTITSGSSTSSSGSSFSSTASTPGGETTSPMSTTATSSITTTSTGESTMEPSSLTAVLLAGTGPGTMVNLQFRYFNPSLIQQELFLLQHELWPYTVRSRAECSWVKLLNVVQNICRIRRKFIQRNETARVGRFSKTSHKGKTSKISDYYT
jgi:hypothetical protein